jgi:hypothetical protein
MKLLDALADVINAVADNKISLEVPEVPEVPIATAA